MRQGWDSLPENKFDGKRKYAAITLSDVFWEEQNSVSSEEERAGSKTRKGTHQFVIKLRGIWVKK